MSGAWIAGSVRAQLLASQRRLGAEHARDLAAAPSLSAAVAALGRTGYGREVRLERGLAGAQRAIAATTLLNLRVLAGWLPGDALGLLRALAAWFELVNIEDRVAYLGGLELRHPFELGALAAAWPRAAEAQSIEELRRVLAGTPWGDPDGLTPAQLSLGLRLAWARRADAEAPEARRWTAAAVALLLARELFISGVPVDLLPVPQVTVLGAGWRSAATFAEFVESLPPEASWVFAGIETTADLWRAEGSWWHRLEVDAESMLHGSVAGRGVVVAAVALLVADAHRAVSALEVAARRGLPGVEEAFDAAA
ncbi:MAG: hypothetical protein ACXVZL_09655 [Gaiellaceae bacterium]